MTLEELKKQVAAAKANLERAKKKLAKQEALLKEEIRKQKNLVRFLQEEQDVLVSSLPFSKHSLHILHAMGIRTLFQLVDTSVERCHMHYGHEGISGVIAAFLQERGLPFREKMNDRERRDTPSWEESRLAYKSPPKWEPLPEKNNE